ncbi:MAG: NADH-quinone oxidoreductase subunit N [Candidatus Marsarchaeota archaeon]|nr:NADH-quinone oxidoreductase subunit N [Candidatus Marsarchaeota archaeon]
MNSMDLLALSPFLVLAATPVLVMLVIAFYRNHFLAVLLTAVGLVLTFAAVLLISPMAPRQVTPLILVDGYALFFMALILGSTLLVSLLSYGYLKKHGGNREEFYVLLLTAALGAAVMVSNRHFASFFLGLETLNISLYALIAYLRNRSKAIEAGIKYLILAAMSDAFLLFGMALVYAQVGGMDLNSLKFLRNISSTSTILVTGVGMLIVGIGFKLAVVPFHIWTPDVYEGAPAPVTAFIATVSKGAMFVVLFRYLAQSNIQVEGALFVVFSLIAVASMFVGNLLALLQNNVKRILAYSSIAHMGYLLVAFLASRAAITAVSYYLVAYFVTTLGVFGVITVLSGSEEDADRLEDFRGLAWRRPWLAGVFTAMLLSLAGIPLTAGFVGKFYVMAVGIGSALWLLVTMLVINSAIGLFYYLRIIVAIFSGPIEETETLRVPAPIPFGASVVLAALTLLLLFLGVYPAPVINVIQTTAAKILYS